MIIEIEIIKDNKFDCAIMYRGHTIESFLNQDGAPSVEVDGVYIGDMHIVKAIKYVDKM